MYRLSVLSSPDEHGFNSLARVNQSKKNIIVFSGRTHPWLLVYVRWLTIIVVPVVLKRLSTTLSMCLVCLLLVARESFGCAFGPDLFARACARARASRRKTSDSASSETWTGEFACIYLYDFIGHTGATCEWWSELRKCDTIEGRGTNVC